jgi:hypothetical protein
MCVSVAFLAQVFELERNLTTVLYHSISFLLRFLAIVVDIGSIAYWWCCYCVTSLWKIIRRDSIQNNHELLYIHSCFAKKGSAYHHTIWEFSASDGIFVV